MNDVERDLRQLLQTKSAELDPIVRLAPREVMRRSRRRQLGTVVAGVVSAVAIVAVSIAGLQSLAVRADAPPAGRSNETPAPGAGSLPWRREGGSTVAVGQDLGSEWELKASPTLVRLTIDGQEHNLSLIDGSWVMVGAPGGAFLVANTAPAVGAVSVLPSLDVTSVDGRPAGPAMQGRWMPGLSLGHKARIWLVPLSGVGSGLVTVGDRPPTAISWPPGASRFDGQVLASGGDDSTSWAVTLSGSVEGAKACVGIVAGASPHGEACFVLAPGSASFGRGAAALVDSDHAWVILRAPAGADAQGVQGGRTLRQSCEGVAAQGSEPDTAICVVAFSGGSGSGTIRVTATGGSDYGPPLHVTWSSKGAELQPPSWPSTP